MHMKQYVFTRQLAFNSSDEIRFINSHFKDKILTLNKSKEQTSIYVEGMFGLLMKHGLIDRIFVK